MAQRLQTLGAMDALLINIATNGSGQSPLASSESGLEGDETAFAEALSSAMAASMQTAVKPDQQSSEQLAEGNGGQLLAAVKGAGTLGAQPDPTTNADQPTGGKTPVEAAAPGLNSPHTPPRNPLDPTSPSDRPTHPTKQSPSVDGAVRDGTGDPFHIVDGTIDGRGTSADAETVRTAGRPVPERPSAEREKPFQATGGSIQPSTLEPGLAPLENTAEVGTSAAPSRPQVSMGFEQPAVTEAQTFARPSAMPPGAAGKVASTEVAVIAESTDRSLAADNSRLQPTRLSQESDPARAPKQTSVNPSNSPTIDPASSADLEMTEAPEARTQPITSSKASTLDLAGQRDLAQLLAVRPDSFASPPRPSPGHRPAKPLVDGAMPQFVADGVSAQSLDARPQSSPSSGRQAQPGLTLANEAGQKPVISAPQAGSANPTAQVSPAEDAGLADTSRFHSLLTADGAPIDGDRFEPVTGIGSTRPSSTPAPAAPGVQIGLQIARSLANGVERLTVHLHPAELGSVDIRLNFEDSGRLTAQIVAERPETLELLQRDSRLLERSLGDSGLKLTNDGLSFSLKQDQQQQQAGQQFQQQADRRQTAAGADRAYDDALTTTEDQPLTRRMDGLRLLDIET